MKKEEAVPGTKVFACLDAEDEETTVEYYPNIDDQNTIEGYILDKPARENHVWVAWTGELEEKVEDLMAYLSSLDEDDVVHEELELDLLSLEKDVNEMEKEFAAIEDEIEAKMKAAAALIYEAGALAEQIGSSLQDLGLDYELVRAMDDNGWNSSSWGC